jgi:hypothetical protein
MSFQFSVVQKSGLTENGEVEAASSYQGVSKLDFRAKPITPAHEKLKANQK